MEVIVYHGAGCHACHEQMELMERHGVEFSARDVTKDVAARQELIKLGSRTLPTTVVNGNVLIGFEVDKLKSMLGIA